VFDCEISVALVWFYFVTHHRETMFHLLCLLLFDLLAISANICSHVVMYMSHVHSSHQTYPDTSYEQDQHAHQHH
jgi:hypothetical protein